MIHNDPTSLLRLDSEAAIRCIVDALQHQVGAVLLRRGLVVAMSGGVDSSVCAALAVRAFGAKRVFALMLPERDSDPASRTLAVELADQLGIKHQVENITPILEACGCYARRDEAIRRLVPDFADDWGCKIVLPGRRLESDRLNVYYLAVRPPGGEVSRVRLPAAEYLRLGCVTPPWINPTLVVLSTSPSRYPRL